MKQSEKTLAELMAGVEHARVHGSAATSILSVACDSRKVASGALFFALPGDKLDGNRFVPDAIAAGAAAIASAQAPPAEIRTQAAWVELEPGKERRALARAASNFYDHPAEALKLVEIGRAHV